MEFFVPGFSDSEQARNAYEAFRSFSADTIGWEISERLIYALRYRHNGIEFLGTG